MFNFSFVIFKNLGLYVEVLWCIWQLNSVWHTSFHVLENDTSVKVTATCICVPVMRAHAESVNLQFEKPLDEVTLWWFLRTQNFISYLVAYNFCFQICIRMEFQLYSTLVNFLFYFLFLYLFIVIDITLFSTYCFVR